MSKSPLINGKLPNGKWRRDDWPPDEWALVIGNYVLLDNGMETTNEGWVRSWGGRRVNNSTRPLNDKKRGWTKIESIVEVYYKKL